MIINKVPKPHQKKAIKFCLDRKRAMVCHETGSGKACRNGTKIRTLRGLIPIEELNLTDKVLSSDGLFYKVTGIYPQGREQLYRIHFSDYTYLDVSGEHLWKVHSYKSRCNRKYNKEWEVLQTKDMLDTYILKGTGGYNGKRLNYSIPYCKPIQYHSHAELPIHPYVIGCLIGDGCISGSNKSVGFANVEEPIINKLKSFLPECSFSTSITHNGHSQTTFIKQGKNSPFKNKLKDLGLWGCNSQDKFIPKNYLYASINDRYRLLEGLLDTDGCITSNQSFDYYTISSQLKDDIIELVRSLGGRATCHVKPTWCTYKGKRYQTNDTYRITCTLFDITELKISKKHVHPKWENKPQRVEKYITAIEPVDTDECTCISVDSPDHTFVTENFTVTHNTLTMLTIAFLQLNHNVVDNVIIVATNSAIRSIVNEMKSTFNEYPISIEDALSGMKGIILIAYQNVNTGFIEALPKNKTYTLILDEFHKVKSSKTNTTKMCNKLKAKCLYRYGFTATPIMKEIKDLYSLVKWLNPMVLGTWQEFCDNYTLYYKIPTAKGFDVLKPYKYRNYEKLKRVLDDIIDTYFSESNIIFHEIMIPLEDLEGYRKVREEALVPTGDEQKDKALPMQAVKKCKHFVAISKSKLLALIKVVREHIDKGVIVYCDEYYTFNPVYKLLKEKCGFEVLKYAGTSSDKEKDKSFEIFTKHPENRVLLLSRVGGASLNLQSTNQLVMVDMPSSIGAVQQLTGRVSRMDSKYSEFDIHLLITQDTVEDYWLQYIKLYAEPLKRIFNNENIPKGMPSYNEFLKKKLINDKVWNR